MNEPIIPRSLVYDVEQLLLEVRSRAIKEALAVVSECREPALRTVRARIEALLTHPPVDAEPTEPSRYIWWCTDCREYSTAACPRDGHLAQHDPSAAFPVDAEPAPIGYTLDVTAEQFATPIDTDAAEPALVAILRATRADLLAPCATCGHANERHVCFGAQGWKCSVGPDGVKCSCTGFVPPVDAPEGPNG